MKAVTIAARNYLPYVRLLAASFAEHHPDDEFCVLLIDATADEPFDEPFTVLHPGDLDLGSDDFARMAFMYDVTELATALKPWALRCLLDRGAGVAVYIDPDCKLYADLGDTERVATERGLALVPHRLTPMPRDGLRPSETDIMASGIFNLGYCAVGEKGRPVLAWWQERLATDSISDPANALFTDQRWMDWVPALFEHGVLRDPGLDVAYWNLDERDLRVGNDEVTCAGEPLRFFHFSGYRPARPWSLSKYVADNPRIVLSEYPQLRPLLDDYSDDLVAHGADEPDAEPYRFGTFPGGVGVPHILRRYYRQEYIAARRNGTEPPPVPDAYGEFANLKDFFGRPADDMPRLSEYASILWHGRPDLMAIFSRPEHESFEAFQDWLAGPGVEGKAVPEGWALSDRSAVRKESHLVDTFGVNLFGYFTSELGLGEMGRLLLKSVETSGVPMTSHVSVRNASHKSGGFTARTGRNRFPINLVAINADHFVHWYDQWGDRFAADAYTIGLWAWELETFPPHMLSAMQYVDEIWAISEFVADSLRPVVDVPVHVFRHPVKDEQSHARPSFLPIAADRPYFAFAFDYFSEAERKNPAGLIEAFARAFPNQDGPALVVKSMNGESRRTAREKVRAAVGDREDVILVDQYVSRDDMQGLIEHALAFVSLHRAEGLGLGMFEAMSKGVPAIATGYSGNLEFMTDENSVLLPYTLVPTGSDAGPYSGMGDWAEPDVDAAAAAMARFAADPQAARELGRRARADLHERFSLERSAEFVRSRLREVFRERLALRVPSSLRQPVPYTPPPEATEV